MPRSRTRSVTVDEVRARFEQWRETRQGKARIPDELWAAAAEIARREGVNRTAAALGLDGGKLKRRMVAANVVSLRPMPPTFVELVAPPAAAGLPDCTIELEGGHGKLRIHWRGATAADLAQLSRALWEVAS